MYYIIIRYSNPNLNEGKADLRVLCEVECKNGTKELQSN